MTEKWILNIAHHHTPKKRSLGVFFQMKKSAISFFIAISVICFTIVRRNGPSGYDFIKFPKVCNCKLA